jgi:hypothetical protein
VVYGLKSEEELKAVEIFVGEFDCRDRNHQQETSPPWASISKERKTVYRKAVLDWTNCCGTGLIK